MANLDGHNSQSRRVGSWLSIGVLLAPIIFAWVLLGKGYSARARLVGFAWLAGFVLLWAAAQSNQQTPPNASPDYAAAAGSTVPEEGEPPPLPSDSASGFVWRQEINVLDAPDGAVINHFYRGQRVDIYDRHGDWVRVSRLDFEPRWIHRGDLAAAAPQPLRQPASLEGEDDPRLAAVPRVGEYGHTEADVLALRAGARALLAAGTCTRIDDANKSVNVPGLYYVNCGQDQNRFFRMDRDVPQFCGRTVGECR